MSHISNVVGGRVLVLDGTKTAPGWGPSSELTTGAYRIASGRIGFSVQDTLVMEYNANQCLFYQLMLLTGSLGMAFVGDTTATMRRSAANTWTIKAGGGDIWNQNASRVKYNHGVKYKHTDVNSDAYTIDISDFIIGVRYTDTDPVTITLPGASDVGEGAQFHIVDEGGLAGTNNININRAGSDTILGATSYTIDGNYNSVGLYSDGTSKWFLI